MNNASRSQVFLQFVKVYHFPHPLMSRLLNRLYCPIDRRLRGTRKLNALTQEDAKVLPFIGVYVKAAISAQFFIDFEKRYDQGFSPGLQARKTSALPLHDTICAFVFTATVSFYNH